MVEIVLFDVKGHDMSDALDYTPTVAPGMRSGQTFFASALTRIGCCAAPVMAGIGRAMRRMGVQMSDDPTFSSGTGIPETIEFADADTQGPSAVTLGPSGGQEVRYFDDEDEDGDSIWSLSLPTAPKTESSMTPILAGLAVTGAVIIGGILVFRAFRR